MPMTTKPVRSMGIPRAATSTVQREGLHLDDEMDERLDLDLGEEADPVHGSLHEVERHFLPQLVGQLHKDRALVHRRLLTEVHLAAQRSTLQQTAERVATQR